MAEGEDGNYAFEGCPRACGECDCQDSFAWYYKGKSSKGCDWVSKKVRSPSIVMPIVMPIVLRSYLP